MMGGNLHSAACGTGPFRLRRIQWCEEHGREPAIGSCRLLLLRAHARITTPSGAYARRPRAHGASWNPCRRDQSVRGAAGSPRRAGGTAARLAPQVAVAKIAPPLLARGYRVASRVKGSADVPPAQVDLPARTAQDCHGGRRCRGRGARRRRGKRARQQLEVPAAFICSSAPILRGRAPAPIFCSACSRSGNGTRPPALTGPVAAVLAWLP
jgi:hypothetical protein